jgi:hypothetical protein
MRKHGILIALVAIGLLINGMLPSKADNPLTPPCAAPATTTYCDNTALLKLLVNQINTGITTTTTLAPATAAATVGAVTVTSSSAQALAGASRKYLLIKNESASAFIACRFAGTAALNTAGSITLAPYAGFTWESSYVPSDAVNCISSAATSPATFVSN